MRRPSGSASWRGEVFVLCGCSGLARCDFFVDGDEVLVNELNTIPGFTETSVYGKLFEAGRDRLPGALRPAGQAGDRAPREAARTSSKGQGAKHAPRTPGREAEDVVWRSRLLQQPHVRDLHLEPPRVVLGGGSLVIQIRNDLADLPGSATVSLPPPFETVATGWPQPERSLGGEPLDS